MAFRLAGTTAIARTLRLPITHRSIDNMRVGRIAMRAPSPVVSALRNSCLVESAKPGGNLLLAFRFRDDEKVVQEVQTPYHHFVPPKQAPAIYRDCLALRAAGLIAQEMAFGSGAFEAYRFSAMPPSTPVLQRDTWDAYITYRCVLVRDQLAETWHLVEPLATTLFADRLLENGTLQALL